MTPAELRARRVQRIEPAGVNYEPPERQIAVWGIHEASDLAIGIKLGDAVLWRAPGETVEALRVRAMRELVPHLPPDAPRDPKGKAVGHFIYPGLPEDHCAVTPRRLAGR